MKYLLTFFLMCIAASGQVRFNETGRSNYVYFAANDSIWDVDYVSISLWCQLSGVVSNLDTLITRATGSANQTPYAIDIFTNGTVRGYINNGTSQTFITNSTSILDKKLHHVAMTYEQSSGLFRIYTDGRLESERNLGAYGALSKVGSPPLWIGAFTGVVGGYTRFFEGSIDDVRVYKNMVLSGQEVAEIYRNPWVHANKPEMLLRTEPMTNDTGTVLTGVARNLGTGADGTYSNAPIVAPGKIQTEKPLTMELP